MNVFRLLVYAIIAVALLWFFFTYLEQFFSPPSNAIEKIELGIQTAKLQPGKTVSLGTLVFSEKTGLSKSLFSETGTDSILECNSQSFCCDKGVACGGKAIWTEENLSFNQKQLVPAFARCKTEYSFFACKVFVGSAPAQLELKSVNPEKTVDLQTKNQWRLSVEMQNTGKNDSLPGIATLTVSKKQGNGEKKPVGSRQKNFETIAFGQTALLDIDFPIAENGDFEAVVRIESDNAGYAEQTVSFQAINQPSPCRALNQQARTKEFDNSSNECIEKFFCAECTTSTECKQKWLVIFPDKNFEIEDSTFVQTRTTGTAENCR